MEVQKVTDPTKIVTDPVLLAHLEKLGVDKDFVEFVQDYAPAFVNGQKVKEQSPCSKYYLDRQSGKHFAVISQLPKVDTEGNKIEVGWEAKGNGFASRSNLFTVWVDGLETTLSVRTDQPDGRKAGQHVIYQPRLFLDDIEQKPVSENAALLATDPLNGNYSGNTLEWDFGICKRRLRIIEGRLLGYWLFEGNPGGAIEILYNQQGDFRLRLGRYAAGEDRESIPFEAFSRARYPFIVSDSATFYPDTGTTSCDGVVGESGSNLTWATIHDSAGNYVYNSSYWFPAYVEAGSATDRWTYILRGIYLFDTSSLPDAAVVSSAALSIAGEGKGDGLNCTPNINIYSSNPASNTSLTGTDYSTLGATPFSDTPISYADWKTDDTYNDFVLNAAGLAAISKTGVSKFGARNANYDVANIAPTWSSGQNDSQLTGYFTEIGTGYQPKLVVAYTAGSVLSSSDSGAGIESSSLSTSDVKTSSDSGAGTESSALFTSQVTTSSDYGTGSEISGLVKSLYVSDGGSGADNLKSHSNKAGGDMKLHSHQSQVGLPHREVKI